MPGRTVAPHGVTAAELRRFSGALHLMKKRSRVAGELWWLTTDKGTPRSRITDVQKRISRYQKEHDLLPYNVTVFETRSELHAHILFLGTEAIANRLRCSSFGAQVEVDPVHDPDGLAKRYLAKERTPQAGFKRTDLGGRISGSHRLPGGGDRVRLSRELERDAIEAGFVKPWQHTNAKRKADRKDYALRRLFPKKAPRLSGQILMFPDLKPPARLKDFRGGKIPPAVREEIEFRRRQRGLSQRQVGALIGVSQGQLANALRGHDPISAPVVNRLRDALLA